MHADMIGRLYTKVGDTCADATVNIVDSNSNPIGSVTVPSGGSDTFVVNDLPCSVDSKEWVLQFIDQTDIIQVLADANNIATFTSGSGANIGVMEVSTDGVTYAPITFPFTPSVGTYYFKRSTALITATYTISE